MRNKHCIHLLVLSLLVLLSTVNWGCKQASGINQENTEIPITYTLNSGIEVKDASHQPGSEITFQGYNIFQQEEMWDSSAQTNKYYTRMVEVTITDSTIQDKSYFFDGQIIRPNYHDFPDKNGEYITATIRIQRPISEQGTLRGYVIDKMLSFTPINFDREKILSACLATLEANTERLKKEIPERIPKDWLEDAPPPRPFTAEDFFQKKPAEYRTVYPDVMVDFKNNKAVCRFASQYRVPAHLGFVIILANIVFDLERDLSSKIVVNFIRVVLR